MGSLSGEVRSVIEWVVKGTPFMVYGVMRSLADEGGLTAWDARGREYTTSMVGVQLPIEVFMKVPIRRKKVDPAELASLSLQLLPGDRTLISIEITPEHESTIMPFIEHLAQRLIELGFTDEPLPPKRPLGFTLP